MALPDTSSAKPAGRLLAIGVPVYNGERYLRETLESLLAQTFREFDLVISDNASTDATPEIASAFARADSRVRYFRNAVNLGVFRNYDLAFSRTDSKYFKWASGNDLCHPEFLEACVSAMEADSRIGLSCPSTMLFEEDPSRGEPYRFDLDFRDADPVKRFSRVIGETRLNNAFNGVYRSDWLRLTGLNREYRGSDVAVVAAMALRGHIALLPQRFFLRRMTPGAAGAARDSAARRQFFVGTSRDVERTPAAYRILHLARAIYTAPLPITTSARAWRYMVRHVWWSKSELWCYLRRAAPGGP
ncbi:MAG: glycosyltransferase family 2 protein [Gammaproteobacteria bacterium]|nr:glycosyltransferase family 2 protein [Gammaproteobacteria bacterium]